MTADCSYLSVGGARIHTRYLRVRATKDGFTSAPYRVVLKSRGTGDDAWSLAKLRRLAAEGYKVEVCVAGDDGTCLTEWSPLDPSRARGRSGLFRRTRDTSAGTNDILGQELRVTRGEGRALAEILLAGVSYGGGAGVASGNARQVALLLSTPDGAELFAETFAPFVFGDTPHDADAEHAARMAFRGLLDYVAARDARVQGRLLDANLPISVAASLWLLPETFTDLLQAEWDGIDPGAVRALVEEARERLESNNPNSRGPGDAGPLWYHLTSPLREKVAAKIAVEDSDTYKLRGAVSFISDQELLTRLATEYTDQAVNLAAAERLASLVPVGELSRVVDSHPIENVRIAALDRLVAVNDSEHAADTRQKLLAIARKGILAPLASHAATLLERRDDLLDLARDARVSSAVRVAAAERLVADAAGGSREGQCDTTADQEALLEVVRLTDLDVDLRIKAARALDATASQPSREAIIRGATHRSRGLDKRDKLYGGLLVSPMEHDEDLIAAALLQAQVDRVRSGQSDPTIVDEIVQKLLVDNTNAQWDNPPTRLWTESRVNALVCALEAGVCSAETLAIVDKYSEDGELPEQLDDAVVQAFFASGPEPALVREKAENCMASLGRSRPRRAGQFLAGAFATFTDSPEDQQLLLTCLREPEAPLTARFAAAAKLNDRLAGARAMEELETELRSTLANLRIPGTRGIYPQRPNGFWDQFEADATLDEIRWLGEKHDIPELVDVADRGYEFIYPRRG